MAPSADERHPTTSARRASSSRTRTAFLQPPSAPATTSSAARSRRRGQFYINERWSWGWDIAAVSDKWFLQNYRIRQREPRIPIYVKESISTALSDQGQGDRSLLRRARLLLPAACLATTGRSSSRSSHPVIDYNKRIHDPTGLGGELALDVNVTSLSRDAAQFQQIPTQSPTYLFASLETCAVFDARQLPRARHRGRPTRAPRRRRPGGATSSIRSARSGRPSPIVRADGYVAVAPDTTGYQNQILPNFIDDGRRDLFGRAMPAVGLSTAIPSSRARDLGHAHPRADRAGHRPARTRRAIGRLPERGRAEPRLRRHHPLRVGQVLRLRPRRGRRRAPMSARSTRSPATDGAYANVLFGQSYQLGGPQLVPAGRPRQYGPRFGSRDAPSDYVGALPDLAEHELLLHDPGRASTRGSSRLQRIEAGCRRTSIRIGRSRPRSPMPATRRSPISASTSAARAC